MEQKSEKSLTGKQLLVFEAVQKVINGRAMEQEGLLELANLVPDGNRIDPPPSSLRKVSTSGLFRRKPADEQLMARIMEMIDKGERVTSNYIHSKLKLTEKHVSRLRDKMKGKIRVNKSSKGPHLWVKATNSTKKTTGTPAISAEANVDRVMSYLKSHDWVTMHKLVDGLKITWYPMKRTVDYMRSRGMVKDVEKSNNPAHNGTSAYGRKYTYLEVA